MKILVTGGAGFIGSHLVDSLVKHGHQVTIVDNLITGKQENCNPRANLVRLDIRDPKLKSVFARWRPHIVFHHAAQMNVRRSVEDPLFDATTNVLGTINLLELSRRFGIKKFILASTGGAMYGETKHVPTPETVWPAPVSPYGVAKLSAEQYCFYYWKEYGLPYVAVRYANVYGPRQRGDSEAGVVAIFSEQLLKGVQPVINGDGKQTRDFIYVSDVITATERASRVSFVGSVNVGTGIESSVNAIFKNLVSITGCSCPRRHRPSREGEQRRSALDINLAKKVLRWEPTVSLEDGLRMTAHWFGQSLSSRSTR